jgi:hypothetical protein
MMFASVFSQILGTLCTGFFTVILVISVAGVLGGRFLKTQKTQKRVLLCHNEMRALSIREWNAEGQQP